MKNKKIILPIAILLITSLFIGVSYAWFFNVPETNVDSMEVSAATVMGLEISSNGETWKESITKNDLLTASYIGNRNLIPSQIIPSSSPKTVTNGLLDIWDGLVFVPENSYYLDSTKATDPSASATIDAAATTGSYFAFDIFLKTSQTQDVYLTNLSGVFAEGVDKGLKNSARIAILNQGTAATAAEAQLLNGATNDDVWLWEPNVNEHTNLGQINANTTYLARTGGNVGSTTIIPSYDAVYADIDLIDMMSLGETSLSMPTKLKLMRPGDIDLQTKTEVDGKSEIASGSPIITTIGEGITKLRVYLWIEGQDVDCENGSSGTNINFNLQLSGEGKPKTYLRGVGYDGLGSTGDVFWDYKESITSVTFEDKIDIPTGATSWDVSQTHDSSVMAYIIDDGLGNSTNKLYIQSNGLMYANPNLSNYFMDFEELTTINNIHLLNTSETTDMSWMFIRCRKLLNLDLSSFNTKNVIFMSAMFVDCNSLTSLNLKSFDTSSVTNMNFMFQRCNNLTSLDLSTFNTSNVTAMWGMFESCTSISTLNIGHFDLSKLPKISSMFNTCTALTSLDLKNVEFNYTNPDDYSYMFASITSGIDIRVKDATQKAWVEARLSENYRTGTVHT